MNWAKITDLTYLPDHECIEDNLNQIEWDFKEILSFHEKHKFRSICTYPNYLPYTHISKPINKISLVIDFPEGRKSAGMKLMQIGYSLATAKPYTYSSECDIVLSPDEPVVDLMMFDEAVVSEFIPFKVIIGLCDRSEKEIIEIIKTIKCFGGARYIKTDTGRGKKVEFKEKLSRVKWLKAQMQENNLNIPMKISGGIRNTTEMKLLMQATDENTIFGVSYSSLKEFPEFKSA